MSSAPGCRRFSRIGTVGLLALLLAACAPKPTPLPVLPVATAAPAEATVDAALDALTVDAVTWALLSPEAIARLEAAFDVRVADALPRDSEAPAMSLFPFEGAVPSAYALPAAIRLEPTLPPLDDADVAQALTDFLAGGASPQALRGALANAGYPDGIVLTYTGGPAVAARLLPLANPGPVRWLPVAERTQPHVQLGVGVEAAALLDMGGFSVPALPLYVSAGWQLGADEAGLPVLNQAAGS
jgi:hypothetical protein